MILFKKVGRIWAWHSGQGTVVLLQYNIDEWCSEVGAIEWY